MNCPKCAHDSEVIDSRPSPMGIRRRRQCLSLRCKHRFTTTEVYASALTDIREQCLFLAQRLDVKLRHNQPFKFDVDDLDIQPSNAVPPGHIAMRTDGRTIGAIVGLKTDTGRPAPKKGGHDE